eukprot:361098-Chlamydomonas_euryale.AAC.1
MQWKWGPEQDAAFKELKQALTTAPILALPDPNQPFIVTCDASDIGAGACLSQGTGKNERVIAFMSRKLNDKQNRCEVHDRELLAVELALEKWRHHLQGPRQVKVYTDNWATKFILTNPQLTPRQARWMAVLYEFNLDIEHKLGSANVIADALSRRPDHAVDSMTLQLGALTRVQAAAPEDAVYQRIFKDLTAKKRRSKQRRRDFVVEGGLLCKVGKSDLRLYVPECALHQELFRDVHDGPISGHLGRDKMFSRLSHSFYWPRMKMQVQDYCRTCPVCQAAKATHKKQLGLHKPLDIPQWAGQSVLTKRVALEPTTTHVTAEETAKLLMKAWFSLGMGLPSEIVSDRHSSFLLDSSLHQLIRSRSSPTAAGGESCTSRSHAARSDDAAAMSAVNKAQAELRPQPRSQGGESAAQGGWRVPGLRQQGSPAPRLQAGQQARETSDGVDAPPIPLAESAVPEAPAFKELTRAPRQLKLIKGCLKKKARADGSHL